MNNWQLKTIKLNEMTHAGNSLLWCEHLFKENEKKKPDIIQVQRKNMLLKILAKHYNKIMKKEIINN